MDGNSESANGSAQAAPLAERLRPREFDELLGQDSVWSPKAPLWTLVQEDRFTSILFWGPPGTGKTSLAHVISRASGRTPVFLSAVTHGVKDIRRHLAESEHRVETGDKALLVFMDEIHRLTKNQQDVLLPALEQGIIKFIGATTENPSFEVNNALMSRSLVFRFEKLGEEALARLLRGALESPRANLPRTDMSDEVISALADAADGDARRALNLLEAIIYSVPADESPIETRHLEQIGEALNVNYDKTGDMHYDTISAFIKSIRASHPDAAVYYLARMLDAGEDPVFVARRLVIAASEDVGNANPTALLVATNGMQAVHMIGMPEARIVLSQVTTYLASSPKSNRAYVAINEAMDEVKQSKGLEIPFHLRNAPTKLMEKHGYGKGYAYAHDAPNEARKAAYLPEELKGRHFYNPLDVGTEAQLKKNLSRLKPKGDD